VEQTGREYAFLHIAKRIVGFPGAELTNIDCASRSCAPWRCGKSDFLSGVKGGMSENVIFKHGLDR